ncbi:hypothetical protein ASD52_12765 [Ensifer sp. Root142]|nr:hypothetical protein ASD52_12765 [Ensifer sp. Root142]
MILAVTPPSCPTGHRSGPSVAMPPGAVRKGAGAWTSRLPIADLKGFFAALGCACRAVQR